MQERRLALRTTDATRSLRDAHPIRSLRDTHPIQALRDTHPIQALRDTHPLETLRDTQPLQTLRDTHPLQSLRDTHPLQSLRDAHPLQSLRDAYPRRSLRDTRPIGLRIARPIVWIAVGIAIGAIAEALFDPRQGAGRRARLRDEARGRARRVAHDVRGVAHDVRGAALDAGARARGAMHELRARRNERSNVPDDILAERVRAQIGRPVSTPGALEIDVRDGVVEIRGVVLSREADLLLRTVRRVRGVRDVVDHLERHELPGRTPPLQGGASREPN
jgi:Domain of unknown function (DUF4573)/BON domain